MAKELAYFREKMADFSYISWHNIYYATNLDLKNIPFPRCIPLSLSVHTLVIAATDIRFDRMASKWSCLLAWFDGNV
ncbi:hypothetical protein AA106556_1602 [Neokomagataea tanensis NBRC 106556]|uniref:Uncharacterized protein n=1 Tax=Neokomagataea tanensis NBRC 106556 TaxID=1223519 RepID=A0ABQ0QKG0_9PROT|nr:hypothetical protein AA106556_1602 [Neokomagataea tanensis NBRC 106556]